MAQTLCKGKRRHTGTQPSSGQAWGIPESKPHSSPYPQGSAEPPPPSLRGAGGRRVGGKRRQGTWGSHWAPRWHRLGVCTDPCPGCGPRSDLICSGCSPGRRGFLGSQGIPACGQVCAWGPGGAGLPVFHAKLRAGSLASVPYQTTGRHAEGPSSQGMTGREGTPISSRAVGKATHLRMRLTQNLGGPLKIVWTLPQASVPRVPGPRFRSLGKLFPKVLLHAVRISWNFR